MFVGCLAPDVTVQLGKGPKPTSFQGTYGPHLSVWTKKGLSYKELIGNGVMEREEYVF